MRATWRPLPAWPYPPSPKSSVSFRADWDQTMRNLGDEIGRIDGRDVVIGIVIDETWFHLDGTPKPEFKSRVKHPGAEVSFEIPERGRIAFHTDAFATLHANLRAISNGLEALRAVDRYGITQGAQQYAGFAMLASGEADPVRGRDLALKAGSIPKAMIAAHPDHGGNARDLRDVMAFRDLGKAAG